MSLSGLREFPDIADWRCLLLANELYFNKEFGNCLSFFNRFEGGLTEPDGKCLAGWRGAVKNYKSKDLANAFGSGMTFNASLLTNHRFQRGSRIIVIGKVFATPN